MTDLTLGLRGFVSAALAIPLAMFLVGSGGGLLFDVGEPLRLLGTPYWILAFYGLFELALAGALWIPYLHRLAGAIVAFDAVARAAVDASHGRRGTAAMHLVMAAMGAAIAVLWTSRPVARRPAIVRRAAA